MPKGYVIFAENIHDEAMHQGYIMRAAGTVMGYGGNAIVVNDGGDVIEGEWPYGRTVILEFPSVEKAKEWYDSADYQAIVGERHASTTSNAVIVPGFEMPG